ncbi:MAG: radical SAM protein [Acidobacteria bacterium]|nr:radical SAM protein [Acidobacteriota bacterium]
MRQLGSILLISCYELGHQPLGIASPMAFLQRAGYRPRGLDISFQSLDTDAIVRARFIGISVPMHTALRLGVRVAEFARRINPNCHVCFYGLYAWLNADYLLATVADSIIGGEFEEPLVALVRAIEVERFDDVEGVSRRDSKSGPFLKRLFFAPPSRTMLPSLERYAHLEYDGVRRPAGYVEASRGCLHRCLHCPISPVYRGRFFVVPEKIVLQDIRQQVAVGAAHITFGDPDFLNGPGHTLRIARRMHEEFPDLTFDLTTKVEHIVKHRSLFAELRALGCLFIVSAVESLSDMVLACLEKGHIRADVFEALNIVRCAGISFRPTWIPFTPWATLADYTDILDFVEGEGLINHVDPVQYSIRLLVPPGSDLLSRPAIQPFLGALDCGSFSYHWTHPDPRMDTLYRKVRVAIEEAVRKGESPAAMFYRVHGIASTEPRRGALTTQRSADALQKGSPRLSEPWFC